jgi:salicylate hydroxylase
MQIFKSQSLAFEIGDRLPNIMRVIIVGAGIAGLSLAIALTQDKHDVLVLETASQLAEIGAGVQMTPQAVKYFFKWGLKDDIMAQCIVPEKINIKDKDGSMIGAMQMDKLEELYGAPYIVVHRASLHDILHRHAVRAGAELLLDSKVIRYDFENGAVELRSGKRVEGDFVIAADGIFHFPSLD